MTPTTLAHVANHFSIVSGYVAGCVFAIWIGARSKRLNRRRFIRAKNDMLTFTPGPVARSNRGDALATPKPVIVPKPQPAGGRLIIEGRWPG